MEKWTRKKKIQLVLGISAAILISLIYLHLYRRYGIFKNPSQIKSFILNYGHYGFLVYILLQVIQIVFFFIPGEIFQIAGGYIYGYFMGGILSLIGIIIGSSIAYWIAHKFGKPFVHRILSRNNIWILEKLDKIGSKKNQKKNVNAIVFLLYLIPGVPKDILAYISGISEITFKDFTLYSVAGRIPALFVSVYFGEKFSKDNITLLIIIAVIMSVLFLIGIIYGKKIIHALSENSNE